MLRTRSGEDDTLHEVRGLADDLLGDHAAHRQPEQVHPGQSEGTDHGDRVSGHVFEPVTHAPRGCAHSSVAEQNHPPLFGQGVNELRVPAIKVCTEVGETNQRDTAVVGAELAVDERCTRRRDRAGRGVDEAHGQSA